MFSSSSHLGPNQTSDLNKVKLCVYTIESLLRITWRGLLSATPRYETREIHRYEQVNEYTQRLLDED